MTDQDPAEPAAAAAAPTFALAPGLHGNAFIDYGTTAGRKLYEAATKSLYASGETKYDGEEPSMHNFCIRGITHSEAFGWEHICSVPTDPQQPDVDIKSIWTGYGQLPMEMVRNHVSTYIQTPTRAAQDSLQMYMCLFSSLTEAAQNRITVWASDYTVNGIKSGPLFLKVIIRESHADTNATTRKICSKLMALDVHLTSLNFDVTKLNSQVKIWVQQLQARGESTQDLFANLLQAYKTLPDADLVNYVKQKINDYDEGHDLTADELMHMVGNKYVTRSGESDFEGGRKDKETLIALEAELDDLKEVVAQAGETTRSGGGSGKARTKRTIADWQKVKPTEVDKANGYNKKVNGKDVLFCTKHGYWCAHLAKDCRTKGLTDQTESGARAQGDTAQQRLVQSYLGIVDAESESD